MVLELNLVPRYILLGLYSVLKIWNFHLKNPDFSSGNLTSWSFILAKPQGDKVE